MKSCFAVFLVGANISFAALSVRNSTLPINPVEQCASDFEKCLEAPHVSLDACISAFEACKPQVKPTAAPDFVADCFEQCVNKHHFCLSQPGSTVLDCKSDYDACTQACCLTCQSRSTSTAARPTVHTPATNTSAGPLLSSLPPVTMSPAEPLSSGSPITATSHVVSQQTPLQTSALATPNTPIIPSKTHAPPVIVSAASQFLPGFICLVACVAMAIYM